MKFVASGKCAMQFQQYELLAAAWGMSPTQQDAQLSLQRLACAVLLYSQHVCWPGGSMWGGGGMPVLEGGLLQVDTFTAKRYSVRFTARRM
jgi:hypothetical protein